MSQSGFTPISIYYSTTASAVPTAANLVPGELAINTADGKLYYEDSSGVVQVLATKSTGSIGGSNTQVQFNNSGSLGGSSSFTWDGTTVTATKFAGALNGTVGATTANTGSFTTLTSTAGSNFATTSGSVGIGTTSPTGKLTVNSSINSEGVIRIGDNATYYGELSRINATDEVRLGSYGASQNITFYTVASERMRITSAGNVGIGTSSPDSYATGAKNLVIASSGDSGMTIRSGTTSTGVISFANAENSTSNNGIFEFNHNDLAMNFNIYGTGRSYRFKSAGTEVLRIDASGNLGLGVTPSAWGWTAFQLGTVGSSLATHPTLPYTFLGSNWYQTGSLDKYVTTNTAGVLSINGNVFSFLQAPSGSANATVTFTQAMTLDASGNLGVGTTSPTTDGNRVIHIANSSGDSRLHLTDNTTGSAATDGTEIVVNDGNFYIDQKESKPIIFLVGGPERMRIASTGIVTMSAYGAGAATFDASGVISSVSDETWKIKDGVPINPDAMLQKLKPGYWFYNDEKKEIFSKDRQLGFYAQNVHEAIGEEAAPTPEEGKPWGYYDRSVLAIAVMSLKNALTTIEELKQRIENLENK